VTGENELEIRFRNRRDNFDVNRLESWEGSWVNLKGSGAPLFNDQRQRIGTDIICSSHRFVEVVRETKDIPDISVGEIGRWDTRRTTPGLIRTKGRVTLIEGPQSLILQAKEHGARVQTLRPHEAKVGDFLSFTGLPDTEGYFVGLRYANPETIEPEKGEEKVEPETLEIVDEPAPLARTNAMRLVTIQGKLMETQGRLLSLQVEDDLIPVRLSPEISGESLPTIASELAVTGVKLVEADQRGQVRSVTLATRTPSDLVVLEVPSWWTPQRYLIAISILVVSVFLFVFWTLLLKRRVQQQTTLIQSQLISNAALEERARIARELHDTLSQGFSGVGYQLASVRNHLESDPDRAREKLETAKQMVEHSLAEARESLSGLRVPSAADSLRFPETTIAIARERCEEAELRLVVHHSLDLDPSSLDSETAYACHRIILEGVMNAIRHSGGDSIGIATGLTEHEWIFYVCDNGHGFDPEIKPAGHFGIQGMQERARQIEAGLTVESSSDGTRLALTLLRTTS
jgi:signal transduction histidine kinase